MESFSDKNILRVISWIYCFFKGGMALQAKTEYMAFPSIPPALQKVGIRIFPLNLSHSCAVYKFSYENSTPEKDSPK